jgi:phosphosulfolactate synthase
MNKSFIELPSRTEKPRNTGLTVVMDGGVSLAAFQDAVEYNSAHFDFVKFGWCTALVSSHLDMKIQILRDCNIGFFFGGTLFEKALMQNKVDEFHEFVRNHKCEYVEISNGTIDLSNAEKCKYIARFSEEFKVLSEVGFKDDNKSSKMYPEQWNRFIKEDIVAGAYKVIAEARETGTAGICRQNGEVRFGLIEEIAESGIDLERLVFEAPNRGLQVYFVKRFGSNVNLANISFEDIISLETLRLGLRSDTFFLGGEGNELS